MKTKLIITIMFAIFGLSNSIEAQNWLWGKSASGTGNDIANSAATDANGNTIVVGRFLSPTITFGSITLTNNATNGSLFIVKYNSSGNVLWAKSAGVSVASATSVATDANGNIIVTGSAGGSITFGSVTLTAYIFLVKYDASGNVIWAKEPFSSTNTNINDVRSVSTDINGNILLTGFFNSSSVTFGTITLTRVGGDNNLFLAKFDASGNALWAKSTGGTGTGGVIGNSVASDASGNIIVAGNFGFSSIIFGSTTLTKSGNMFGDMFIAKYDASGNVLWAKSAGATGGGPTVGKSVASDANGNILLAGYFQSTSISFGTTTLTTAGGYDIFLAKYDASGNILWTKSSGGTSDDEAQSITLDASSNILVTGYFKSPSIIFGSTTLTNVGISNLFIVKFDTNGNVLLSKSAGGTGNDVASSICADASGNITVAGSFKSTTISFGSSTLTNTDNSGTTSDMFVAKLNGVTGISENSSEQNFFVFPNPASSIIKFVGLSKNNFVELMDLTGRFILTTKESQIDISNFNKGLYFLRIIDTKENKAIKTLKFVKE